MVRRMTRPPVPWASDLDSSPGTAAGPRPPGRPLHSLSSHLLCPLDCHQLAPARQSEPLKQQILHGPFWACKLFFWNYRVKAQIALWRATVIWANKKKTKRDWATRDQQDGILSQEWKKPGYLFILARWDFAQNVFRLSNQSFSPKWDTLILLPALGEKNKTKTKQKKQKKKLFQANINPSVFSLG